MLPLSLKHSSLLLGPPRRALAPPKKTKITKSLLNTAKVVVSPNIAKATTVSSDPQFQAPPDLYKSLGVKPSAMETVPGRDKDSIIQFCQIPNSKNDGKGRTLVIVILAYDPSFYGGSWGEKSFADANYHQDAWIQQLGIKGKPEELFLNNERQTNPKGYGIRAFQAHFDEPLTKRHIYEIGRYICENVNKHPGNNTTTTVQENNLYLIKDKSNPVFSNVFGFDRSLMILQKEAGSFGPGFYDQHKDLIHAHFRPGTLSKDVARLMWAPNSEIHPSELGSDAESIDGMDDGHDNDDGSLSDFVVVDSEAEEDGDGEDSEEE